VSQNYSELVELGMTLVVRADGPTAPLIAPIRSVIADVSPDQAVFDVKTMDTVVAESLAAFSLYLWLMVGFAVLALTLAAVGTYGVMAFVSASRMREFGVRVALGASSGRLTSLIFR